MERPWAADPERNDDWEALYRMRFNLDSSVSVPPQSLPDPSPDAVESWLASPSRH
jgi:hypothetical protein